MTQIPDSSSAPTKLQASCHPHGLPPPPTSWRPKITGYCLLLMLLTLGLSTTKLFLSFRTGSDLVITTLEFVLYPMLPIIWYAVDKYHSRVKLPRTEEKDLVTYSNQHELIRGYDIMFTLFCLSYGIIREVLVYYQFTTAAAIFDYLGTLCIGIGLYCFGS
ncbi:hypothetical protein BDQ17DRAFT_1349832 [Cyathus striatus]|nr:hypothetical protein BDQ17DRAFT_1349832 [Cyathus striatus]